MKRTLQLIAGSILLLMLAACHQPVSHDDGTVQMELKIYDVPPAQTQQLSDALASALGQSDMNQILDNTPRQKSRVTVASPGKLLVYAPHSVQASIGDTLAALGPASPAPATPAQVRLQFWTIDGQTGSGEDDPALKDLVAGLAPLRQTMGQMHFHLDQVASAVVSSNRNGVMTTSSSNGENQTFSFEFGAVQDDAVDLKLSYEVPEPALKLNIQGPEPKRLPGLNDIRTRINAKLGQYIVLAQAPGASCTTAIPGKDIPGCSNSALRLLVVRVDLLNPRA